MHWKKPYPDWSSSCRALRESDRARKNKKTMKVRHTMNRRILLQMTVVLLIAGLVAGCGGDGKKAGSRPVLRRMMMNSKSLRNNGFH